MDPFPTAWSVTSAFLVFVLGLLFSIKASGYFGVAQSKSLLLYLWHTAFCIVYLVYVGVDGGDALMYYGRSLFGGIDFAFGTFAVLTFTRVLTSVFGLSILGAFLVFNIIGFVGLLAFCGALRHAVSGKSLGMRRLAWVLVFLPSVSFWSSAIGKDAISFAATGLALWAAIDMKRRFWLMGVAVLLMLSVRPHMAAVLVMALAVSIVFDPRASVFLRTALGAIAGVAALFVIPLAMRTSGLESMGGIEAFDDYVERRQGYNMHGGGAIDISSMPLPVQMFTYVFRPLPFEAHNVPSFAASIDNVVLLVLTFLGVRYFRRGRQHLSGVNWVFMLVYVVLAWVILSSTTANLGISMRQKWMFAPMAIFLLVSLVGRRRKADASAVARRRHGLPAPQRTGNP